MNRPKCSFSILAIHNFRFHRWLDEVITARTWGIQLISISISAGKFKKPFSEKLYRKLHSPGTVKHEWHAQHALSTPHWPYDLIIYAHLLVFLAMNIFVFPSLCRETTCFFFRLKALTFISGKYFSAQFWSMKKKRNQKKINTVVCEQKKDVGLIPCGEMRQVHTDSQLPCSEETNMILTSFVGTHTRARCCTNLFAHCQSSWIRFRQRKNTRFLNKPRKVRQLHISVCSFVVWHKFTRVSQTQRQP